MIPDTRSYTITNPPDDYEPGRNDIIMEAENGERVVFRYDPTIDATISTNTPSPTLEEINNSMEFWVEASRYMRQLAAEYNLRLETVEGLWTACDWLDYDSNYLADKFWAWNEIVGRSMFFDALELSLIGDDTQFIQASTQVRLPKFYKNDNSDLGSFYLTVYLDVDRDFTYGERSFAEVRYETLKWLMDLELDCRKMRDEINNMVNWNIRVQDRRDDMYYFN